MGEPTSATATPPRENLGSEQEPNTHNQINHNQQLIMMDNNSNSGNGSGGKAQTPLQSQRNSSSSLFLTLPSNFSPSSLSPRNSAGSGSSTGSSCGGVTPPTTGTGSNQHGHGERKGSAPSRYSPSSHIQSYQPQYHHNYSWEDLRRLFLVSLEKLSRLEPESFPFRQPVDPVALGIPDYPDIIRKPMDLQTIRSKMNNGKYTDPWLYVDDVLRMVDNAWVYNREGSKVYEYCTVLAEVFQKEVNPVMYHLGYKQGRSNSFHFNSDTVNCHGRPVCLILKGRGYWRDTERDMEFNLCETCYQMKSEEMMAASESSSSVCSVTPDVIPNTPNHQQKSQSSQSPSSSSSRPPSISGPISPSSSFVFTINSCKSYSPAAELHRSHKSDGEMTRQLVLREFLRLLLDSDTTTERKQNVFKMLRCNGKLMGEFIEYIKRRRAIVLSEGREGCSVVFGESFTTRDLEMLLDKLKGLSLTPTGDRKPSFAKCGSVSGGSNDNVSASNAETLRITSSSSTVSISSDKENEEELAREAEAEKRSTIGTLDSRGETIQDLSLGSSSSCLSESVEDDTTCLLDDN